MRPPTGKVRRVGPRDSKSFFKAARKHVSSSITKTVDPLMDSTFIVATGPVVVIARRWVSVRLPQANK